MRHYPDVKAFLDYVDGIISNDEFVQEIDQEIRDVKTIERERRSYMTYEMKMREERSIGREEGRAEGRQEAANEGMQKIVATVRDLNLDKSIAVQQLIKRYALTQDDAAALVDNNW